MAVGARRNLVIVSGVVLGCGLLAAVFGQGAAPAETGDRDLRKTLLSVAQVYSIVEQNYADKVDPDKAIYNGAIPGMLRVLDPHSDFFDPKSFSRMRESQRGKYYGIGAQIGPRNSRVVIIAPMSGSPALKAGVRAGDIISAINGKNAENMTTDQVSEQLRGPKGTPVKVTMLRQGSDKPLEFTIIRDEIPQYSVDLHFMVRPGIGYIHITSFMETTDAEVGKALDEMGDLSGLILDLRGNPGGLLTACVGVADKFLPKGAVIVTHYGRSSPEKVYRASHGNGGRNYPIVVIVNRLSASASEILSGAIQDHDRGLIIGEDTFGKGLVQTVFPLTENTGLALTTAKYYTPSGRLIQRGYAGVSSYEYFSGRVDNVKPDANREVKLTDSGRTVLGGGGIAPDVRLDQPKATHLQERLYQSYAFFNFAKKYLSNGQHVTRDFQVTDQVLQQFRAFLTAEKVSYTEAEFTQVLDWIKTGIKSELLVSEFGADAGLRASAETDQQVLKALELMPRAKELAQNAQKTIAARKHAE
jgi:carboxyl-terminal processing protease